MKKLDDITKQNPFEVPNGYFDKLPLKIQNKLHKPQKNVFFSEKMIFLKRFVVVPLCLVLVAGGFFMQNQSENHQNLVVSNEAIKTYLLEQNVEDYEIIGLYKSENLENLENAEIEVSTEVIEQEVDLEDLEEYL